MGEVLDTAMLHEAMVMESGRGVRRFRVELKYDKIKALWRSCTTKSATETTPRRAEEGTTRTTKPRRATPCRSATLSTRRPSRVTTCMAAACTTSMATRIRGSTTCAGKGGKRRRNVVLPLRGRGRKGFAVHLADPRRMWCGHDHGPHVVGLDRQRDGAQILKQGRLLREERAAEKRRKQTGGAVRVSRRRRCLAAGGRPDGGDPDLMPGSASVDLPNWFYQFRERRFGFLFGVDFPDAAFRRGIPAVYDETLERDVSVQPRARIFAMLEGHRWEGVEVCTCARRPRARQWARGLKPARRELEHSRAREEGCGPWALLRGVAELQFP